MGPAVSASYGKMAYPLVMTNSSPWFLRWPIEIDGLPFFKMVDLSMAMLNNQRVTGAKSTKLVDLTLVSTNLTYPSDYFS